MDPLDHVLTNRGEMMESFILTCILLAFVTTFSLSQRSTIRLHSDSESSKIVGAFNGLVSVALFTKCGVANQCKENTCSNEDCSGFVITPVAGAPNRGCSEPDWFSVCVSTDFGFVIGQIPPKCAVMGPAACFWVLDEDGVGSCQAQIGAGFTRDPVASETCVSGPGIELVF